MRRALLLLIALFAFALPVYSQVEGVELKQSDVSQGVKAGGNVVLHCKDGMDCQPNGYGEFEIKALAQAGLVWKGAWDNSTTYAVNDAVSWNGSSYVAIAVSTNITPADASKWSAFALKGDAGTTEFALLTDVLLSSDKAVNDVICIGNLTPLTFQNCVQALAAHDHTDSSHGGQLTDAALSAPVGKAKGGTGADNSSVTFPASGVIPTTSTLTREVQLVVFDWTTDTSTGDGKFYFIVPAALNGMNLVAAAAQTVTAGTTGTTTIQIARCAIVATGNKCSGTVVDMLSTALTIDSGENSSRTAATAAVIDASNDDVATDQVVRVDVDAVNTTAAKGLVVILTFQLP